MKKLVLGVCCCFALAFNCYADGNTASNNAGNGNVAQKSVSNNTNNTGGIYKATSADEYGKVTWQYVPLSPSPFKAAPPGSGISK